MKTLITLSILICTSLASTLAQSVQLQSHMTQTDWVDQVLLNGNPLSESVLNNFPIPSIDVLPGTNTIEFVSLPVANNGVTSVDMVQIRKQLSNTQPLDVDAIIPADIDKSGFIGVNDLATAWELILGISTDNEYVFVHSDINLDNLDPLDFGTEVYSMQFQGADFATTNFDFDVYVHGDTNKSSGFTSETNVVEVRQSNIQIELNDIQLISGMSYEVPFKVESEKSIEAFQIGMDVDGISVTDISLANNAVDYRTNITDQFTRLAVLADEAISTVEGVITFTADRDGMLSEFLSQESNFFDEVVYDDLSTGGLELQYRTVSSTNNLADEVLIISPNPMIDQMAIDFPSAERGNTFVQISNAQGQQILSKHTADSQMLITRDELGAAGIYIISLTQNGETIQKKFIVL